MKKYLLGILAVVLALGFSAFTTKKPVKGNLLVFKYTGADFSIGNVQDESKWVYDRPFDATSTCSLDEENACEIVVDEDNTTGGQDPALSFQITAQQFQSSGEYFVPLQTNIEDVYNTEQ